MSKNCRWGILGAGRIAEKFCTAINAVEGAEVCAVASQNKKNAWDYANKFGAKNVYDNYTDLIKDENVDIIYIATPHAFHFEQTIACLNNKKAVLCEKPMSLNYLQTKQMIETAQANNVFLMEGMWTACMPFMQKIKSIIEQGIIGQPKYITADFGFNAPLDEESRLYKKSLGGGSMLDVGIYPLFFVTTFFGEPFQIKSFSALSVTGVDEYTNVILNYANGATAHIISSIKFNTPIHAEIFGTKGKIKVESPWFKATDISVYLENGETQHHSFPHFSNGFEHEIIEAMQCLKNGLLQSKKMPHQFTLLISKIMDDILEANGIKY